MSPITLDSLIADGIAFMGSDQDTEPCVYINVNDVFAWGLADAEKITIADLPALTQSVSECGDDLIVGCTLWVARRRAMRPQGAAYAFFPRDTWALFDACGPERKTDIGNPYRPGQVASS
jgi:hypothetical protein